MEEPYKGPESSLSEKLRQGEGEMIALVWNWITSVCLDNYYIQG